MQVLGHLKGWRDDDSARNNTPKWGYGGRTTK